MADYSLSGTCCFNEGGGGGGGSCSTTAPGNLSINRDYSVPKIQATWTLGTGGKRQAFGASSNELAVQNNCAGAYQSACVIYEPVLDSSLTHYEENKSTFTEAGTVYHYKVINVASGSCSKSTTRPWLSSCSLTLSPSTINIGEKATALMNIVDSPYIKRVDFSSTAGATVDPASDNGTVAGNETFQTDVTGVSAGTATVTAKAYLFNDEYNTWEDCRATASLTVDDPNPPVVPGWWQVKDGNIHVDSGNLRSRIPSTCSGACKPYLITGETGLLAANGSVVLSSGSINQSGPDWQAQTVYQGKQTGYDYFERILSDDPAGIGVWDGSLPGASGVYRATGNIITDGTWNVPSGRKIVLLADGNVTLDQLINVQTGGFLAIIASGDITVADSVIRVEGVFIADRYFISGSTSADQQLIGEGIFAAWNRILLRRSLADNTLTPAEKFIYRPDLAVNAYRYLLWPEIRWQEVAP